MCSTTNPGGAGKWRAEYAEALRNAHVAILPDNDQAGREHAQQVAASLYGKAASVRIVELPGLPAKGDASDWLAAGGTREELERLPAEARLWEPPPDSATPAGAGVKARHSGRGPSQATRLAALAEAAELFHTLGSDPEPYATIPVNGHRETWRLRSRGFRRWLSREYALAEGATPSAQAEEEALRVLEGRALHDGAALAVHTRIAERDGAIYIDLCNDRWQAVEIDTHGWRVVAEPPVRFRRARGMLPLPEPARGGSVDELRAFVNVGSDADWRLVIAWLVAALRPSGPYPVLCLHGEQGAAKSFTARALRALVDPNTASLRAEPREERDLAITATNSWLVALDNLSHLRSWLSDALCRLATGGGFATRELYSDDEERIFEGQRPVLLTGIDEVVSRGDLLDRCIILTLPPIPEGLRRAERELLAKFDAARPQILGGLLDAVAGALKCLPDVRLPRLPRMADFATWASAAEPALGWWPGGFLDAYAGNREEANELALEADPLVPPLQELAAGLAPGAAWEGIARELLAAL
ncbi:MAG: hypothetical protein HY320_06750, partial [Armatimonadetes bacterium]|nr:hypothetical protein [Armatimonadota bacterium]